MKQLSRITHPTLGGMTVPQTHHLSDSTEGPAEPLGHLGSQPPHHGELCLSGLCPGGAHLGHPSLGSPNFQLTDFSAGPTVI